MTRSRDGPSLAARPRSFLLLGPHAVGEEPSGRRATIAGPVARAGGETSASLGHRADRSGRSPYPEPEIGAAAIRQARRSSERPWLPFEPPTGAPTRDIDLISDKASAGTASTPDAGPGGHSGGVGIPGRGPVAKRRHGADAADAGHGAAVRGWSIRTTRKANIEAGVQHSEVAAAALRRPLALAAYNAGEAAVQRFRGIPPYPRDPQLRRQRVPQPGRMAGRQRTSQRARLDAARPGSNAHPRASRSARLNPRRGLPMTGRFAPASGLYPLNNYQLPGGASRLAALLLPYILPVCSVVAPGHPGAALRNLVLVQRIQPARAPGTTPGRKTV